METIEKRMEIFHTRYEKTDLCWNWLGKLNTGGYGTFKVGEARTAHRVSYQFYKGELIESMQVDHLCSNPICVNPDHLELVTPEQNKARSKVRNRWRGWESQCKAGHVLDDLNTLWRANGTGRQCRACQSDRQNERRLAKGRNTCRYVPYQNTTLQYKHLYRLTVEDYEKADFNVNFIEIFYGADNGKHFGSRDTMERVRVPKVAFANPRHITEPRHCKGCGRLTRTKKQPKTDTNVLYAAHGLCVACIWHERKKDS